MMNDKWKWIYRATQAVFTLTCVCVFALQTRAGHVRAPLGLAALLFLLNPFLARRILRIRLGDKLKTLTLAFSLLAFTLGVAMNWYKTVNHYDDFAHALSGVLFTLLGLCIFARMQREEKEPFSDWALRMTYAIGFSMGIAVLWEMFEYSGYVLIGHDAQNHLTTGVVDTMEDFIACAIGSLVMAADYALCARTGRRSFLVGCMIEFIELNPKKRERTGE